MANGAVSGVRGSTGRAQAIVLMQCTSNIQHHMRIADSAIRLNFTIFTSLCGRCEVSVHVRCHGLAGWSRRGLNGLLYRVAPLEDPGHFECALRSPSSSRNQAVTSSRHQAITSSRHQPELVMIVMDRYALVTHVQFIKEYDLILLMNSIIRTHTQIGESTIRSDFTLKLIALSVWPV